MTSDPAATSAPVSSQHSSRVARLYDKLFAFEVKKARAAYPIHKKLDFADPQVTDIYHWLAQQLPLADFTHILDAGCGVGFGCQSLAQYTSGQIAGISLSAAEINQARRFASDAGLSGLHFQVGSFEDLPADSYDCIFMVESLKHCANLDNALQSVAQSLVQGGVVYVVEDVYQAGHADTALNHQLCRDWHLKKLWSFDDYSNSAARVGLQVSIKWDLTPFMRQGARVLLPLKLALFDLLSKVSRSSVFPVYRGGFILDWLYTQHKLRYQVLEFRCHQGKHMEGNTAINRGKG